MPDARAPRAARRARKPRDGPRQGRDAPAPLPALPPAAGLPALPPPAAAAVPAAVPASVPAAPAPRPDDCLAGGGAMGALHRALDWSRTPVGPVERWPQSLRTAVGLALESGFPMLVVWGPEHVQFYNDAYRPVLGSTKHPRALGQRSRDCWPEIWEGALEPMFRSVRETGKAIWNEDMGFSLDRNGYLEETFFTFSYSAIRDETGGVGGILVTCVETTLRVLAERRLRTLRDLAGAVPEARDEAQLWARAAEVLGRNPRDLPFALLYALEEDGREARLAGAAGPPGLLAPGAPFAPARVPLEPGGPWPLHGALAGPVEVQDLAARLGPVRCAAWPEPVARALVLPVARPGMERPYGFLVAGVSPRRALDEDYAAFFSLAAGQVASGLASARAREEERRRAEALAELDRAKTQFFSNVSHEFRTPLSLMLGPLEDALRDPDLAPDAELRHRIEVAHRNALRLLKLVNHLLDFARLQAGRIEACYEPTDLAALTADLASSFRSAVERAGLALVVDCPPLPEPVYVDREMWEKIVLNLVSNAFKFTFEGSIRVALRAREGEAVLEVHDTGVGIPPEELPRVFRRFHRVRGARARTHEGSGIGLALVQELAQLHGGRVEARSQPDNGSTFTVRVPLGAAHLPRDRLGTPRSMASTAVETRAFVQEAERWDGGAPADAPPGAAPRGAQQGLRGPGAAAPAPAPGATPAPGEGRLRVLVADDNADLRDYVRRVLEASYHVEACPDGASALAAARARPPDLVVADVMMPGLDGFGLLRELRTDPALRAVPVILLSARAGEESKVGGLEAGADDYLVKPFSARELLARARVHAEMARLRRAAAEAERRARVEAEEARHRTERILHSITDGFAAYDRDWRLIYLNPAGERISHVRREDVLGKVVWEALPEAKETPLYGRFTRAMETQEPSTFEEYYAPLGVWVEVRLYPSPQGLSVYYTDITERKRAESELRVAHEHLRELDQLKSSLLNLVAHELRTPLTPISIQLERLRAQAGLEEGQRRTVEMLDRNFRRLVRLIDDTLQVARIQSGKLQVEPRSIDLASVLREAVEPYRAMASSAGLALEVRSPAPLPALADPDRVEQVLANLLSNALRLTPRGGRIAVQASRRGATLVVEVQDTGPGLTQEQQDLMFRPFSQVLGEAHKPREGTGLGLYICRGIVEAMGGRIWVDSPGEGKGSTFAFTLPVAPEPRPAPGPGPAPGA